MDVHLFVPCYVDQLAPQVGVATLRVLEAVGCRVRYDPDPVCCGQPFVTGGDVEGARRIGRRFLDAFRTAEAVVCPSASCVSTVRRRYADLGIAGGEETSSVAERCYELSEFLVRRLGRTDVGARFPHRVALLQSCHGLRDLGLGTPSEHAGEEREPGPTERLLRSVSGLDLVLPGPTDECCGFGGIFSVQAPAVSVRMGRTRVEALARTGASYVTAADASCLLHLGSLRGTPPGAPRPLHLAEILASREET